MIAWADCITVTIGRPRTTAFPPILIYISVRPFDVSGMESSGSARGHACVIESNSWSNVGSKFRLGRETIPPLFEGRHLGEAQAGFRPAPCLQHGLNVHQDARHEAHTWTRLMMEGIVGNKSAALRLSNSGGSKNQTSR